MQLVLLIILIPFCSIGFFVYLNALMNYTFNNILNIPLFSCGIAICLILGFIIFHLYGSVRVLSANKLNYENRVIPNFSYFSFIILVLFGIALIINSLVNEISIFGIFAGSAIIILFIYITFAYIFTSKKEVFILSSIDEIEEKDLEFSNKKEASEEEKKDEQSKEIIIEKASTVKCLTFENEKVGSIEYYVDEQIYQVDKYYTVVYNPKLKIIKKVLNEVNVIE